MNKRIEQALQAEDYQFLEKDERLGEHILYLVVSGSYGYGTNYEGSDIDLRGCTIERPEVIYGLRNFEQYEDEKTDTVIYGLKKFVRLAIGGNPNILELLGVPEDCILKMTQEGKLLRDNADLFLSQRIVDSFGGYALAQLRRLQNALAREELDEAIKQKHIIETLTRQIKQFNEQYKHFEEGHIQIYRDEMEKELNMDIRLKDYPLKDFAHIYSNMANTIKNYEKLNHRNHKKDEQKLYKHAMHLIRILMTGQRILEGKGIQTRLEDELPILLAIRYGEYSWEKIFQIIDGYEKSFKVAAQLNKLPAYPDEERVNQLLLKIYKSRVGW